MTTTTKVVAWVGAIFGASALVIAAVLIVVVIYSGNRAAEQQRQQEKTLSTLKQGLTQDIQNLSKMEIKPMTGDEFRRLNSSPTPGSK
jgi:Tfp pilus assembly protein PilN